MNTHPLFESLADGVWLGTPAPREGPIGAFVHNGEGVVIDTTSYSSFARDFLEFVQGEVGAVSWRYLLVTHKHFDHFGAAEAVPATLVAHELTASAMSAFTPEWLDRSLSMWLSQKKVIPELIGRPQIIQPQVTFDSSLTLLVGGEDVRFFNVGGHTADLSYVHIPSRRVVFGSDNFFNGYPPVSADSDVYAWIVAVEGLRALEFETLVAGHGIPGGRELIDSQVEALREVLAARLPPDSDSNASV